MLLNLFRILVMPGINTICNQYGVIFCTSNNVNSS